MDAHIDKRSRQQREGWPLKIFLLSSPLLAWPSHVCRVAGGGRDPLDRIAAARVRRPNGEAGYSSDELLARAKSRLARIGTFTRWAKRPALARSGRNQPSLLTQDRHTPEAREIFIHSKTKRRLECLARHPYWSFGETKTNTLGTQSN